VCRQQSAAARLCTKNNDKIQACLPAGRDQRIQGNFKLQNLNIFEFEYLSLFWILKFGICAYLESWNLIFDIF
jgi:hypothetical protein